ncbi:MAG: hypothetical protein WCV84_04225 [Patescibacteria group bacterium]
MKSFSPKDKTWEGSWAGRIVSEDGRDLRDSAFHERMMAEPGVGMEQMRNSVVEMDIAQRLQIIRDIRAQKPEVAEQMLETLEKSYPHHPDREKWRK